MPIFLFALILFTSCASLSDKGKSDSRQETKNYSDKKHESIKTFLGDIDKFIDAVLAQIGVPGLAIAVIEGDEVILSKGYGIKALGKSDKMTPDTLMMIGSVTKSLTGLLMADLVDKGAFSWDTPAISVMPNFKVGDAKLTSRIEMQHLLCACTGIARRDLPMTFNYLNRTPKEIFKELAELKPVKTFKEAYLYQNQIAAASGYIASLSIYPNEDMQNSYAKLMQQNVFLKMGMLRTTVDIEKAIRDPNIAMPHAPDLFNNHRLISIDIERFATSVAPSGGIWSSVNEMTKYLQVELGNGKTPNGLRLFSEANFVYRRFPQVKRDENSHYGLGWNIESHKGLNRIFHPGTTMGYGSLISFFPDQKLGLIILSNSREGGLAAMTIYRKIMELWFGGDEKIFEPMKQYLNTGEKIRENFDQKYRIPGEALMQGLLGKHVSKDLGPLQLEKKGDTYYARISDYNTELRWFDGGNGIEYLVMIDPPRAGLAFKVSENGKSLSVKWGDERYDFVQTKQGH